MSDVTTSTARLPMHEPLLRQSRACAVFACLSPAVRGELDRAIVNRDPPTYREIHAKFRLAEQGVGYWSLYRYARKLRLNADLLHLAQLTAPDEPDLLAALPKLLAQRLFQALLYEDNASPSELHRLTYAYRAGSNAALAREKLTAARATAGQCVQGNLRDNLLKLLVSQHSTAAEAQTSRSPAEAD
ncbi:MAG TPA: hypothetical protein VMV94_13370 [Phycisphaerae bacterium]|nr:hypothetical protein [Phycisphaerae bacterium]